MKEWRKTAAKWGAALPKKEDSSRADKQTQTMPVDATKGEANLLKFMVSRMEEKINEEER